MQNFNLIAQSVLKLSHCEKGLQRRRQRQRQRRHPSGLNYSPRRNVFRRGQKWRQRKRKRYHEKRRQRKRKGKRRDYRFPEGSDNYLYFLPSSFATFLLFSSYAIKKWNTCVHTFKQIELESPRWSGFKLNILQNSMDWDVSAKFVKKL